MSFIELIQRSYKALFQPPNRGVNDDAVRFGLLGASGIAPLAVIGPARSHPEAVIAAVAARDRTCAEIYAKKHQIPIVHDSYQDLLNDPSIDAVYIALPNGLHYEWALRSLQAGKHVLLEKPATCNAIEAKKLFLHPLLAKPNAPILLEGFHYQFHPAWQTFLSEIRQAGSVESVLSRQTIPRGAFKPNDIRFRFDLGGGCLMDVGTYALSAVRQVFDRQPIEVVDAESQPIEHITDGQIDRFITASICTKSGKTASVTADIAASFKWPSFLPESWQFTLPRITVPTCQAVMEEIEVDALPEFKDAKHLMQKTVTIWNSLLPVVWHRIDVTEKHRLLKADGKEVKKWEETRYIKAYSWSAGDERAGACEDWWSTWRCQMEEFIHRVKGRKGSGVWIDAQETIDQMTAIDDVYLKAGMNIRPTSMYE